MDTLLKDLSYGFRNLLKHPGFSLIVIATLAIGIGASTVIFSVVNSVVLRRLPYRNADRIVAIQEVNLDGKRVQVTSANFLDWRAQNSVFEQLAAIKSTTANLALAQEAERIELAVASANFFTIFGTEAQHGRLFVPDDEKAGHAPIVVLSHTLWERRFGADPSIVGKTISLDDKSYNVVGIAAPGFHYPDKTEAWLPPLRLAPELNERMDVTQARGMGYLSAVALLKPGVPVAQAANEMESITARLRQQYPETNNRRFNRVVSLQHHLVGETDRMLWLLFGAVTFVLLIACANVANLLLASGAARQKEMAVRTALGASRWRVVRQLLTESMLLAFSGGAIGLLLAFWGLALMTGLLPQDFPRLQEIALDWRVLGFAVVVAILTGVLFGLAPALQLSKPDLQDAMRESGRGLSGSRRRSRLRNALIVAEVALSVVLLAGAGLLFRSFMQLQAVNTGFSPERVLTVGLAPSGTNFRTDPDYVAFYQQVKQKIGSIPGVEVVGVINRLPLSKGPTAGFRIEGRPATTPDQWPFGNYRSVSHDYFRSLSIPVLEGRSFTERDDANAPPVLIINQALAQQHFPNENPVGKRVSFDPAGSNWLEIVGVANNVRSLELREEAIPEFYFSYLQNPFESMSLAIKSRVEPMSLVSSVRQAVAEVNRSVPVSDVKTMDFIVDEAVTQPRFNLFLLGLFGAIALLLSAAGIYGVTAYTVNQRTHELGIRLALGAQVGDVLQLILRQGVVVIAIGLAVGLVAAFALTRFLRSMVFEVSVSDPLTFVAITLLLLFVGLLACYIPARRATKVDPLVALRYE